MIRSPRKPVVLSLVCLVALATLVAAASARADVPYAVVVSKRTHEDPKWGEVVKALVAKHQACVIEYEKDVSRSLPELKRLFPRYACFVAQPDEAGRLFVVSVHRLTRKLNDDPYTDVMWGIITGYDADDALRIAKIKEPLTIRKAAGGIVVNLDVFDEAIFYRETSKNEYVEKKSGKPVEQKKGNGDDARPLKKALEEFKPDLFVTSGHATERDWQIGYPTGNEKGMFISKDGKLIAVDRDRKHGAVIHSDNPKVLLSVGNCLMGHVRDRQAISLAWMHTAGVDQMIGYTVNQWYPAAGFGTMDLFFSAPGRYTLNDAFFFNNQKIVHDLETRFPKTARRCFEEWDLAHDRTLLGRLAGSLGYAKPSPELKDNLGLLWDRDTFAFYGDPAWEVKLAPRALPFSYELTSNNGVYTFRITATADCKPSRELAMRFPRRLKNIEVIKGKEFAPLVTPTFIMVTKPGSLEKGKTYEVTFKAELADDSGSAK